jgi:hypothetical protein
MILAYRPIIFICLTVFGLFNCTLTYGQNDKKPSSINIAESYKLVTENKYVADLLNQKYADSTITNFIKFDESFAEGQDYYEYWIYQEQPKIMKIYPLLIIRINRFDKIIYAYDAEKDKITLLEKWVEKNK